MHALEYNSSDWILLAKDHVACSSCSPPSSPHRNNHNGRQRSPRSTTSPTAPRSPPKNKEEVGVVKLVNQPLKSPPPAQEEKLEDKKGNIPETTSKIAVTPATSFIFTAKTTAHYPEEEKRSKMGLQKKQQRPALLLMAVRPGENEWWINAEIAYQKVIWEKVKVNLDLEFKRSRSHTSTENDVAFVETPSARSENLAIGSTGRNSTSINFPQNFEAPAPSPTPSAKEMFLRKIKECAKDDKPEPPTVTVKQSLNNGLAQKLPNGANNEDIPDCSQRRIKSPTRMLHVAEAEASTSMRMDQGANSKTPSKPLNGYEMQNIVNEGMEQNNKPSAPSSFDIYEAALRKRTSSFGSADKEESSKTVQITPAVKDDFFSMPFMELKKGTRMLLGICGFDVKLMEVFGKPMFSTIASADLDSVVRQNIYMMCRMINSHGDSMLLRFAECGILTEIECADIKVESTSFLRNISMLMKVARKSESNLVQFLGILRETDNGELAALIESQLPVHRHHDIYGVDVVETEWDCSACTYYNKPGTIFCGVCDTHRDFSTQEFIGIRCNNCEHHNPSTYIICEQCYKDL